MIRINQIKLPLGHDRQDLPAKVSGILGIPAREWGLARPLRPAFSKSP